MKPLVIVLEVCLFAFVACSPGSTPTLVPTPTMPPLATAAPVVATPPPGPALVLHAYMRSVHERVLPEYAGRSNINLELLGAASSRGFDADMLCPGPVSGSWQHFDDLVLEASGLAPPPQAEGFHAALVEALAASQESAESYDWFCATYAAFGQPAEGMWSRLIQQVRASQARIADLHTEWEAMGGEALNLAW